MSWKQRKAAERKAVQKRYDFVRCEPKPDMLRARDIKLATAPRDLTAALCGDPLPGYSALDRRQ